MTGAAAAQVRRRAFMVAIQKYEQLTEGLATELPGTHDNALEFRRWLLEDQGLSGDHVYFCTEDETLAGRTAGATLDAIRSELKRLKLEGKDQTEELYFYFSGHGFCYTDSNERRLADVLIAANYVDRDSGPSACVGIDDIQQWLRMCLGPLDHFYFIDCCRNYIADNEITVSQLGIKFDRSALGYPTVYTLYSTVEGQLAPVASGFTGVLVEGLRGTGRAKVWRQNGMAVLFDSVGAYVSSKLQGQPVDESKNGSRDGVIREIAPPPKYRCEVLVNGAADTDRFKLKVSNSRGQESRARSFKGPTYKFSEVPDDYDLSLTTPGYEVEPIDRLPADLYEDRTVRFTRRDQATREAAPRLLAAAAPVTILGPAAGSFQIRDLARGSLLGARGRLTTSLGPGRHLVKVIDDRDVRVGQRIVNVVGRQPLTIDLTGLAHSPLRDTVLRRTPGQHTRGAVDFSETLGPTPDQGLDLWLALIGAASIVVRWPGEFSKLEDLALASFYKAPAGSSPVYVLAGFDDDERFSASLSAVSGRRGPRAKAHPEIPGLHEFLAYGVSAGNHLLSLRVGDAAPLTTPVTALADRVSLVTVSRRSGGDLQIQRFVLPIPHLASAALPDSPLDFVRRRVEMQRQFAGGRDLDELLEPGELEEVVLSGTADPIGALLAAYEMARRGRFEQLKPLYERLWKAVRRVPDIAAIGKMLGSRVRTPADPPLFLEGLLEFDLMAKRLPLPVAVLDFHGPWTVWRATP